MDPLSITGAVLGLVRSIASISKTVDNLKSKLDRVPEEVRFLASEIDGIYVTMNALDTFIKKAIETPRHSKHTIPLDKIVTVLTEATLTISQLEMLLKDLLKKGSKISFHDRFVMAWKYDKMEVLVRRLQRNNMALNQMYNIVQW